MAGPRQVVAHFLGDRDEDGLTDDEEVNVYGTNPDKPDTDDDGLTDGDEVLVHLTNPIEGDSDGDGLKDGREVNKLGTDPMNPDSDEDGIDDGSEGEAGMDPLAAVPGLDLLLQSSKKAMMRVGALSSKGVPWKFSTSYGPVGGWKAVGFEIDEVLAQSRRGRLGIFVELDNGSLAPSSGPIRGIRGISLRGFEGRRALARFSDGNVKLLTIGNDGSIGATTTISGISTSMDVRGLYGNRILAQAARLFSLTGGIFTFRDYPTGGR